ncbi:MAG: hypothetical protein HYY79_02580 [Betaproteobacteria bacterium]|nr:hypothetical protein [Betaproteobacteria bacterium]
MPTSPVTEALILQQAEQLLDIKLTPQRAAELAGEVERMNSAVIESAGRLLDFNDEPARFATALLRHARSGGARK